MEIKEIIIACGAGVATSTLVNKRVSDLLEKSKIKAHITQCTYTEVNGFAKNADLIIASSRIAKEINGIPVFVAIPYISGIGIEEFEEKIVNYLNQKK
jgi:Phosphotransferase system, galactitol-specific IIB component